MNDSKSSGIKVFIIFSIVFLLSSCLLGTLYGAKKNDFEVKKTISSKKNEINYTEVNNFSLDKYSSVIKKYYLSNLKKETSKEVQIFYYDENTNERTENYFKIYISDGMLYTYESENGSKINLNYSDDQYNYVASCKLSDKLNSDYLITIIKNDKTIYTAKFTYSTKTLSELKQLELDYKNNGLYKIKNVVTNAENIYLSDENNNLHMIYEENDNYFIEKKDIFSTNSKLYLYNLAENKIYVNFDGTLLYGELLLKDINGNIIFANQIFTDCINTEKNEFMMYIIDYRGMVHKKLINSDFPNNNSFEIMGKIKGINFEETEKGIQKINILYNNENEETLQAGTNFIRFNLTE